MTDQQLTGGQVDDLERLIDRRGIEYVLMAIVHICSGKAEHVATQWQDTRLAKQWGKVAHLLERATAEAENL